VEETGVFLFYMCNGWDDIYPSCRGRLDRMVVCNLPIATKVVSSNPVHCEIYPIQHYVIRFVSGLVPPRILPTVSVAKFAAAEKDTIHYL
jgi:hypothetical protein